VEGPAITKPVRILIVDDRESVRRGVARILSARADLEACGEAENGTEALTKAIELRPDLILLDISMPGPDGLAVARLLRKSLPMARILVMSQHSTTHLLPSAIQAGAHGCLDKSRLAEELLPSIERLFRGTEAQSRASEPPTES
jgi:two-component system, NarL family, response regulator NreC